MVCRATVRDDEGVRGMREVSIGEFALRSRLSLKALRLYDERGVLTPARVDRNSGYRYYDVAQLNDARLISMLRQLDLPLATIKVLLACDPANAADQIAAFWRQAESAHDARRDLVDYLVNKLRGERPVMYEVAIRDVPQRSVLCLKRNVNELGAWALGKEFIELLRERPLPKLEGREGAMFSIYWGEVGADSDGPVEWCKPVPEAQSQSLASHYPELTLRIEPAHREAYVALPNEALPTGPGGDPGVVWQLASEALRAWAHDQGLDSEPDLIMQELGVRITYLANGPITETSAPNCDFAVPFAVADN